MRDLSSDLTVFVITTSNEVNYPDCIKALKNQTVKFKLEIIKDYFPLSKAFQEMLYRCSTKYYIEVDSDMILDNNGVELLYDKIIDTSDKQPMACFKLLDIHLDFPIYGVKIYKFDIFKKYPYNLNHPSCEIEQLERLAKDGYNTVDICIPTLIGKHSPKWTNESIFERYYNLMEKFKLYRYVWLERLPSMLSTIYQNVPTSLNFYAVAGMLSSIYSDKKMAEEKNICTKRVDFAKLEGYIEKPHQATIYMTSQCNFKCPFCYRHHSEIEQAPDATSSMATKLLHRFPTIKGVCICGFGEPLMSPNLVPVLKTLKSANKVVGIITNGSLLRERLNDLIGWFSPDYISVSLNAHCRELHQKVTGTTSFDLVLENIQRVVNSKIPCYVSSVVTTENLVFLPDFLKLVKSLGVKTVHLHNILPHFKEEEDKHFWDLALTIDNHQSIIEGIKKLPEASIVKKYPTLIDKNGGRQTCKFPWSMVGINGNGSLSICNSVYPCNKEKFGHIEDYVVWNSEKLQKFRQDFVDRKIDACKKCFRNYDWGM